ncbi:KH domain-containing protein [Loa loa]|nr:KH domain-containing protein [Loa loa]EJD73951.1 KH domain-containing protein [Loa loa]
MDSDNVRLTDSSTKKSEKTPSAGTSAPSKMRILNSKRSNRVRIMNELKPFLPLLPNVADMEIQEQKQLFQQLYSAGIAASASLHKWLTMSAAQQFPGFCAKFGATACVGGIKEDLCIDSAQVEKAYDIATALQNTQLPPSQQIPFTSEDAEALKTLSRSGILDDAVESLRQFPSLEEDLLGLKEDLAAASLITPDIAAAALSAFAAATLRRPPTRTIESLMASSQDPVTTNGGPDSTDDESLELNLSEDESEDNGDMLLNLAVSAGYLDLTKELVEIRGNPNYISTNNDRTPLMEACCAGHSDIVKHLLEHGADMNAVSATKNTPLIYASAAGNVECASLLLDYGCDITIRNDNGHCALMEAASSGYLDVVSLLVQHGFQVLPCNQSDLKVGLESALTLAAYKGHYDVVQYLLEKGANKYKEELHTALMEASMDGHYEVAKLLLDNGAPVNLASDSFESPLTLAACGGHPDLVRLLLERGAIVEEVNDEGYTPLMEASREGHLEVVRLLIKFGAKVNIQTDETGETALTLAACGGFKDVAELLVRSGARLDIGANTPLMEAAQEGHLDTVRFILNEMRSLGLPIDATTTANSNTALTYAAENGHLDVCAVLIEFGANIDHQAENGRTALMKAAKNGNYSVIQFLLMRGAKVNEVSTDNDASALFLACAHGHWEIVRLLLDHGADPSHVFKDGMTCMIEASRNGHTRVAETLLNWHDAPVVTRTPLLGKPLALQNSRLKKVARRTVSKKATAIVQPKVECAEKSLNNLAVDLDEKIGCSDGTTISTSTTAVTTAGMHPQCTHDSHPVSGTHNVSTNASIPAHLLAHYNYQNAINPDELRGMIAGMAAMAAQSNALPNDHLFAQIAEKALRGTFANNEITGGLADKKMHQQFSELLKQQFSILANRQKDALAGLGGANSLPDSENGGSTSYSPSVTPSPSPPMIACCETTAAHAAVAHSPNPAADTRRKDSTSNERQKTTGGRGTQQKKGGKSIILSDGEYRGCFPPASSLRFPAPPPPVMNANLPRESVPLSPLKAQHLLRQQSPPSTKQLISDPAIGRQRSKPVREATGDESSADRNASRSRGRTLSESAMHVGDGQHTTERTYDTESDEEISSRSDLKSGGSQPFNVDMQTESNHDTALTLAATGGHDSLVELLITRGANIEHKDKKGFTPIILAATGGHVNVVELLLNHGANIEAQSDRTKDTALSLACSGGRKEVVELLLKRGANKEHRNVSDYTPLSLAASGGYVDIVNLLLNNGAEINSRTGSKLGISPLMLAAMNGHAAATKVLLERGSDINSHIETNRNTALTLACFQGRTDVVRLLLEYNANVEHRAKTGLTPLMEAANGGYVDVGELLLAAGADPNASPVPSSRDTALTIAADKGHHKFVEMLIHARALIDARNKKGCTALWLACHGGHLETVQTLVKHNADVDVQDNRHVSPLIIAFRRGHIKVVKYMVRHVQQFPNDTDCYRFIATINEKDLLTRCHLCMDIIVAAKDRQAAEANRAAESLLEILAKEEEQAKSKKLSKQRQNEKKKAKRKAKKNQTDGNTEQKDSDRKEDAPINNGEESADEENGSEKASSGVAVDESNTQNRDSDHEYFQTDPPRVPALLSDEHSADEMVSFPETSPGKRMVASTISVIGKSSRHRVRKESGKSAAPVKSPPHKTGSGNTSDTEWMKATSRRSAGKAVMSGKGAIAGTVLKEDSASNTVAWRHVDSSRRRSVRLSVSSNSIARVIGRAGGNINAIREATGAYIEVEKQTGKKEQHDRQITLKGSDIALRQAVEMIHGLIDDSECNVEEVIQRVSSTHNTSTSQSEENTSRSNSVLTLSSITPTATIPVTQKKSHTIGTAVSHPPLEMSHNGVAGKKTIPYNATTNVWAQRAAQRQSQKVVSAIGSEKKQKMSSGAAEQENPNPDQALQLRTPGIVYPMQEMPAVDAAVLNIGDETQKRGLKEFCRAPGHARPTSASASSPSVSPIGLKSPIHIGPGSAIVASSIGTTIPTATMTDIKPRTESFEAGPKIEFPQNVPTTAPLPSASDIAERKLQPLLGTTKSNLGALKTSSIDEKLFSSLDPTRPSIMPSSIANIWDDNIVDDKPWAVPAPLAPVQLEDFARNINVQLPTSAKPARDYPNPNSAADHVVDLAKNIASLRTSEDRPVDTTGSEAVARRSFLGENIPPFDLNVPFSNRDPIDWGNAGPFPTDTFARWRSAQLDSAPMTGSTQEIDSSSWIDQVAARLASTRQEHPPFPPTTSYAVSGNSGHVTGSFGTDIANVNLSQQQSAQAWSRMHFQQAAQAASNEYESLTNLLSSYRPTNPQHQPVPLQQQPSQPILPVGNINYSAATTAVGPTSFRIPAPRSQIANTSIPPPPFFNSQIPPPSSMSHHGGIPITQSSTSAAWSSIHFGGQAQTNTVTESTQFPQYPSTTRGNWSYNW